MKKLLNKKVNKGITLIALVITIVVLIILAGVIINITIGNGGIIDRAKTAKEQYQNAQDYEETEIAKYTNEINSYIGGNRNSFNTPNYSGRVSIFNYSSSTNKYTCPSDGFILVPSIGTKNGADFYLYIDDLCVSHLSNSASTWIMQNSILPVSKDSKVYYTLSESNVNLEDNAIYFIPVK